MAELTVTQTRSGIGGTANQRATLHTLGLRRIGDSAVREDRQFVECCGQFRLGSSGGLSRRRALVKVHRARTGSQDCEDSSWPW